MIDFTTLQGLTIPEGVVSQITDESGRVIWALVNDKPIVLEVEKITSDTYAGETTYTGEQFILLDIYPKTNGTVNVTYGGLTKTITDTSGAAEPNAQQVFFGTFNGVSDSVATAASGELTIDGDCVAFACSEFSDDAKSLFPAACWCVTAIADTGTVEYIPDGAFGGLNGGCNNMTTVKISNRVRHIGSSAFFRNTGLTSVSIPKSVVSIGEINPWGYVPNAILSVDSGNKAYKIDGNCLMEIATKRVVSGFAGSTIPSYTEVIGVSAFMGLSEVQSINIPASVTSIYDSAFSGCSSLTSIAVPDSVTRIGNSAFSGCSSLTSVTLGNGVTSIDPMAFTACSSLTSIEIPSSVKSIGSSAFNGNTSLSSVFFANTSGWYVTATKNGDISTGTAVDLSDPANNATLLKDTYKDCYWYRS